MAADIFIIGTDSATSDQITRVLETVGYKLQAFPNVSEALSELDPHQTHLVFVDTSNLSADFGPEIESIQQISPGMEFILLAEYQDPLVEEDAKRHNIHRWIYRPFTPPEIILKVFAALEGASSVGMDGLPADEKAVERETSASESES